MRARWKRRGSTDAEAAPPDPADDAAAPQTAGARLAFLGPNKLGVWLSRPMTSFHLMVSIASLLVTLGLIMVLSASGVHSYDQDGSPWSIFVRQLLWTVIGLFACWFALRLPVRFLRRIAFAAFATTVAMLVLVLIPGIGHEANGTRGWFVVAGLSMQPSELAKIAFVVWGSHILAARRMERASLKEMLVPLIPAAVIALGLIIVEPDLGQTVLLGIILLALLWFGGLPLKVFVSSLLAAVTAAAILALSAGYRSDRVQSWLDPSSDAQGAGYQARQAKFALANGGVFGDGLGQGTAKWNYLPNAHNDFIFAIVGEELGFIGAFGLLALFGAFAYTGMRIAKRSADPFLRLLTAATTTWVIGQVFINVGYVIGLLPVTGIQLPLISAGGTSTATTLFMVGLMANAARHEPDAVASLRAGREDRMNRLLRLPLPEAYAPTRVEALRDRLRTRPGTATARPARAKPANTPKRAPRAGDVPREAAARNRAARKQSVGSGKAGTAQQGRRGTGHHGSASQQRRADVPRGRAGHGQRERERREHEIPGRGGQRRSRTLEGQRHG